MASSNVKPESERTLRHAAAKPRAEGASGPVHPTCSAGETTVEGPNATARRERRISEILLAAAACEPAEREVLLRQSTTDPELLEEVQQRLRQAAELPSAFLAVPAAEILEATRAAPGAPSSWPVEGTPPLMAGTERYELGECLGRGGMSRVFRAFDRQLERPVALKLLERADPRTLSRFQREAQIQAKVRHEYVLEVYETGELGGQPFIAMYYVDGPTLLGIRDETTLEQKIRLMAQVAEGLHAAHREGLIHRDVKPSNILVEATADGRLKPRVADFGIAVGLGGGSSMWSLQHAGTPCYIAPERLYEDERPVDRRSDIYSLGVTIYQLLTGELPFHDPNLAEIVRQVREDPPPALRDHEPALPAELEAIVSKCLAKDPDARYPTARAVAEDLWRFLDGKPVEAYTTTFTYRLAKSAAHGRNLPTGALIAGILLITLLGTFAVWTSVRARRVANDAEEAMHVAYEAEIVLQNLAATYHAQERYADAEPLYRRVLEFRVQRLGLEHPETRELLQSLILLYEAWGRPEQAEEIRAMGEPS